MHIKKYKYVSCSREIDSDIIIAEFVQNLKVDLEVAKELVTNRHDFTENKAHYVLIDCSNSKQISSSAKAYLQDPEGGLKNILGSAFVASNPVAVLIANVFLKTETSIPSKFFTNKTDAYLWLKKLAGHA
jgi:hypothetical protein